MIFSFYPTAVSQALHAPLAVVIPVYNEEATISTVVAEWRTCFDALGLRYQMLLINDGSTDGTREVLRTLAEAHPGTILVVDKPNAGHGRSCRLGYDAAVGSDAVQWVLQIDSDGQCDPSFFAEFWRQHETSDCVFGYRVRRDDGVLRALTSKICKLGASLIGGSNLVDPNVPYRLLRAPVLREALAYIPPSFDIHNVALTFVLKKNMALRWAYVPIRFRERQGGKNSIRLLNVAHLGTSMLFDLAKLKKSLRKESGQSQVSQKV